MRPTACNGEVRVNTAEALELALRERGLPEGFSVVPAAQRVPRSIMHEIDELIAVFDRVTTRPRWQEVTSAAGPVWAREPRDEVCFFSAWDFHLPHGAAERWQLIEVNDNGSGFLFASIIDRAYYDLVGLAADPCIEPPPTAHELGAQVAAMVEQEARGFFGERPGGVLLVLDDADSLARGHFRAEHEQLAALLRARGWRVAIGAPEELSARGDVLQHRGDDVRFVVNRSTDFLWQADAFAALRECFAVRTVYVAPNPFTYVTRSDKRLLELLSHADRDAELGITPDERAVLAVRVPETRVVREDNLDELAARKHELFFKPAHGYASHGTITGDNVGRSRLRRLVRDGEVYVAQRFVPRGQLVLPGDPAGPLYTDLRVWAYRGARYLVSGRGSRRADRNELATGGWLPTFVEGEDDASARGARGAPA